MEFSICPGKIWGMKKTTTEGLPSWIKTNKFATKFVGRIPRGSRSGIGFQLSGFQVPTCAVSFREGMDLTFLPYLFQLTPPKTHIFVENQWLEAKTKSFWSI